MGDVGEQRARSPTRVSFVPPSRHLSCTLCDYNFKEVNLPCGHMVCRACVLRWFARQRTCPECRVDIPPGAPLPTNWTVRAMMDELRVRYRFGVKEEGDGWVADEAGCPARLSLDGAAAHEATCGFATTTCPFAGCGASLRRSDVALHNEASVRAHLDGERAARLAGEAAATSRFAAMEARLLAFEGRLPPAGALRGLPSIGWVVRNTIQAEERDEDVDSWHVRCCAFSPDSTTVCVALKDSTLKLFFVASGDHRLTLEGHDEAVTWLRVFSGWLHNRLWIKRRHCKALGRRIWRFNSHAGRPYELGDVLRFQPRRPHNLFWLYRHFAQALGRHDRRVSTHAGRPHGLGPLLCIQCRRCDGALRQLR